VTTDHSAVTEQRIREWLSHATRTMWMLSKCQLTQYIVIYVQQYVQYMTYIHWPLTT